MNDVAPTQNRLKQIFLVKEDAHTQKSVLKNINYLILEK